MGLDYIFAYGATMNRSETRSWLEANGYDSSLVKNVHPGKLSGYDFVWNFYSTGRGSGLANIERKEGALVYGVILEIDSSLLKAFDRKEGHPTFFSRGANRISVERISDGRSIQAWVYVASGNRQGRRDILPSREYKKVVLDAVLFWELPQEFMDKVRDWETM